ncbi:MAG: serine protease [Myxococcales bacterium]|nr:serine protease [Myxococcales bacterium]
MDTNYYFVLEPGGSDDGPYVLSEIRRRIGMGLVSRDAALCKVGEINWLPVSHERYAALLEAPRRPAHGTMPVPASAAPHIIDVAPLTEVHVPTTSEQPLSTTTALGFYGQPTSSSYGAPAAETMPNSFIPPAPVASSEAVPLPYPEPMPSRFLPPAPAPTYEMPNYGAPQVAEAPKAAWAPKVARPAKKMSRNLMLGLAGGGVAALGVTALALLATRSPGPVSVKNAMVRVTTASGTGAGFFIDGPDGYAYVATANHVVDRGERVLIERDVGADKHAFVEAYPQTEIVASDPDADLAIIRIKNVEASRFERLPLAKEPIKDARILSYGYPGSSLAKHAGLVSKDGKILSLASFPAYDQRYMRIVRENAVDGLLISTDIEPGFSGGPTLNDDGQVVGVNVTKDRAHVGQNGAVSVVALRSLVKTIKPASVRTEPTPADVVALLEKIESEYLLLPLEERSKVRETDFVSAADLPTLRRLVGEVRREERNTDASTLSKFQLSGQAALGIYFARLPGKLLETYRAPTTSGPLAACELTSQKLTSFLGDLSTAAADKNAEQRRQSAYQTCDELAVRPLGWDLVAATLQWDGKEKDYSVTKLERMDDDEQVYRASVRISGAANLIEVWFSVDQHAVRLKLFDSTDNLYAIKSPRTLPASALQGTWSMKRPRVTDAINKDAEIESNETLAISIGDDGKVSLRHVITERYFGAGNRSKQFKCNHKATIETGLLQSFTGSLDNGVVVALPEKAAEPIGADAAWCEPSHRPDRIVAAKLAGTQLYLYRTDGSAYPETIELTKE